MENDQRIKQLMTKCLPSRRPGIRAKLLVRETMANYLAIIILLENFFVIQLN